MKTLMILFIICVLINTSGQAKMNENNKYETATFASGCFWCTEAVFQNVKGVKEVVSGYTGGNVPEPTYEQVCSGTTGHAEAVQITYDPNVISYLQLLEIFFSTHDPTSLNRQGADVGTQYRSAVFYHNEKQKKEVEAVIEKLKKEKVFDSPIVTEVVEFKEFYKAEEYHQNYYEKNSKQPYCAFVITPKLEKFKKIFSSLLKKEAY